MINKNKHQNVSKNVDVNTNDEQLQLPQQQRPLEQ